MCVAVSGRIISIDGNYAKAEIFGNIFDVNIKLTPVEIGDYVLIHAGCAIERVKKTTADEVSGLWKEIESYVSQI